MDFTRHYPAMAKALAIAASILAGAQAAAAPAGPSFDCKTHKVIREKAVCNAPKLTELDRDMEKSFRAALKRAGEGAQKALRDDQRKFASVLDNGFLADLMDRDFQGPEEQEKALKEALADPENSAVLRLEKEIKARIEMLNAVEARRKGFAGIWRNAHAQLTVREVEEKPGTFKAAFRYETYGWAKYRCELKAEFTTKGKELFTATETNEDSGDDLQNSITLSRTGSLLRLKEGQAEASRFTGWSCPNVADLNETLVPVSAAKTKSEE
jgi:hypothetical protein